MLLMGASGANATPEAYAYFDASDGSLNFCYDEARTNRSNNGYQTFSLNSGYNSPAWSSIASKVKELYFFYNFANYYPKSTYRWAHNMTNLTSIKNITYLNTSSVTVMEGMFQYCTGLTSIYLNLDNFKTTNVTTMRNMFNGCSNLTTLNISKFDTSKVTDMGRMFQGCKNLTNLYVSNFNTSNVTTMSNMFDGCEKLTSLDVSKFNTSNVTDMSSMFYGCKKLKSLSLSNFNTSKVKVMGYMFSYCSSLTSLDVSNFNTENVTDMQQMFYGCSNLTTINLNNFSSTSCTKMAYMFANCTSLTTIYFGFPASSVKDMSGMFYNCTSLKNLYNFPLIRATSATNLNMVFYGCSSLTTLDLTKWAVNSSPTTSYMFKGCTALKSLSLSQKLTTCLDNSSTSDSPFEGVGTASSPCSLTYPSSVHPTFSKITPTYVIWRDGYFKSTSLKPYAVNYNTILTFYYDDYSASRSGTVYDLNTGTNEPEWHSSASNISSVVFNSNFTNARPTTCYYWFDNMKNITSISGLSYLNTSSSTNMTSMFGNCSKLTSLDLTGFNTGEVTIMASMFRNCSNLTSLNISKLNTSKVTNMYSMFFNCSKLTSINLSNFNTAKVTTMQDMFYGCSGLTSLIPNYFNTSNVTDMSYMFYGCSGITSLNISNFNTAKVTNMEYMFAKCSKLTSLDLSNFIIPSSKTAVMLENCSGLQKLTIPATASNLISNACLGVGTTSNPCKLVYPDGFTPEKTSTGSGWYMWKSGYFRDAGPQAYAFLSTDKKTLTFYYDENSYTRTGGTAYGMNTSDNTPEWYDSRTSVTKVMFSSSFANARPTSCYKWFYGMTKITGIIGLNYLNTVDVTNFESMFENCTSLASVDVSGFRTRGWAYDYENIYYISNISFDYMFKNCSKLTSLDLSNLELPWYDYERDFWDGYYRKDRLLYCTTSEMFSGCKALKKLSLPYTEEPKDETYEDGERTEWFFWATMNHMADDTCLDVGTPASPCELIYPSWFFPENISTTSPNWYMWKGGYFKNAASGLLGDANGDGDVSVADVLITVDYVLGKNPASFIFANANVNGDSDVTIADVTAIVDLVLNKQ